LYPVIDMMTYTVLARFKRRPCKTGRKDRIDSRHKTVYPLTLLHGRGFYFT
jgi:hypothetical protein